MKAEEVSPTNGRACYSRWGEYSEVTAKNREKKKRKERKGSKRRNAHIYKLYMLREFTEPLLALFPQEK